MLSPMKTGNVATDVEVFALAACFATKVKSLGASGDCVQSAINDRNHRLWLAVENSLKPSLDFILRSWQTFYRTYLGKEVDFSGLILPDKQTGFDRSIILVRGLTMNQVYDACAAAFPCWRYSDDLDATVAKNDRDPQNGTYAIWIRDRVEADVELDDLSANMLAERKIKGITLLERMLFELKYFSETGEHLDVKTWTLCSGSRDLSDFVPRVHQPGSEFRVYSYSANFHRPCRRSREVISL